MSQEQSIQVILQDIAVIKAGLASANKMIEKSEMRTSDIHRLTANLENLAEQLKIQNARWEKKFDSFDLKMREQKECLIQLEKREMEIQKQFFEKKAKRWDAVLLPVGSAIIIAIVFYFLGQLGLSY